LPDDLTNLRGKTVRRLNRFFVLAFVCSAAQLTFSFYRTSGAKQNTFSWGRRSTSESSFQDTFAWGRKSIAENNFQDARDYLNTRNPEQLKDFLQDTQLLLQEFNAASSSLFKAYGEFESYAATEFLCSVEMLTGQLGTCLLTVVGTHHEVDPKTGVFKLKSSKTYPCMVSIRASIGQLMFVLEQAREEGRLALEAPLPNEEFTLKNKIKECLDK